MTMQFDWQYYQPVRIESGVGALQRLPQLIRSGTWLLVTTPGFRRRGLVAQIEQLVPGVKWVVHDGVTPNPELDDLEQITTLLKPEKFNGILAIGGGSVLDAAKVLSVTLSSPLSKPLTAVLRDGDPSAWSKTLQLIAVPTTSGTGSEVTPFATVWDQQNHKKHSVTGPEVLPDIALLDPQLTLTLPYEETLFTGLDAISHALESLWNKNRNAITESYARQALLLANAALPLVLEQPDNIDARAMMQQASMLAGLAISQTRTAIAHSISYPLTSHYGVPHGLACSFTLPALIRHVTKDAADNDLTTLFLATGVMLDALALPERLRPYLTKAQLDALRAEMYTPERAGNYAGPAVTLDDVLGPA
jgi:phosphonate metabolism-associated iron-containing alcohol dehydrogenase